MKLVHTLLFMLRQEQDMNLILNCLKSLECSTYHTVVVYNQGNLTTEKLQEFLKNFKLDFHVIGEGVNVGTSAGRQKCFEYIWQNMPDTQYISELHLDMIFSPAWEDSLIQYLEQNDDPLISCGIIDKNGAMPFINQTVPLPDQVIKYPEFLIGLQCDQITRGFTNPCIHVSEILKRTGGYNTNFLKGQQCFEDDSMLLGYYYYYGTKRNWNPKVNWNSMVYHRIAGQRLTTGGKPSENYAGLIKQYGIMGLKALSELHGSEWHKKYFLARYNEGIK